MRESSDRAQNFLDTINSRFGNFDDENTINTNGSGFRGEVRTESIDMEDVDLMSHQDNIQEVARNIDAEIMDEVYSTVRNNSDGRHEGHNEFRVLRAVDKQVATTRTMDADRRTIEQWYEDFRRAGLTYPGEQGEKLTTEGEFFVEEAYRFMDKVGDGQDDEKAEDRLGNLFRSLSRKYDDQGEKLYGFLLMAETDESVPDIHEEVGTTRRTAYNWANEWLKSEDDDEIALMRGEPSDRELTDIGRAAYNMLGNQYQRMDATSEMKAEMIEQIEETRTEDEPLPYIPGNQDMVAQYTDRELVDRYMSREGP